MGVEKVDLLLWPVGELRGVSRVSQSAGELSKPGSDLSRRVGRVERVSEWADE